MLKNILIIIFILAMMAILGAKNLMLNCKPKVCTKNICFNVLIANTQKQRQQGLMYVKDLPERDGMLFVFEKSGNYSFWMKNTFIMLDIIWIDKNKKIVYIEKNAKPCTDENCPIINPGKEAQYVLEINGGLSTKYDINIGDEVKF